MVHASAWCLATLHGRSKWSGCGRVLARLLLISQTKRAHEIVRIRTSLRKQLPIVYRANFIVIKRCVRIFSPFSLLDA